MKTKKEVARGLVRQGDVLLVPVDDVDASTLVPAPKDPRGLVLAEGETSFHHHAVFGRGAKLFAFKASERQERMLAVGRGGADVRVVGGGSGGVDRHHPISLKPGAYLVRVQKTWSAEMEAASNVCD